MGFYEVFFCFAFLFGMFVLVSKGVTENMGQAEGNPIRGRETSKEKTRCSCADFLLLFFFFFFGVLSVLKNTQKKNFFLENKNKKRDAACLHWKVLAQRGVWAL